MIILYSCKVCSHIFDEVLVRSDWHNTCECGSRMFHLVRPSVKNILKYILGHPLHAIKRILEKDHE